MPAWGLGWVACTKAVLLWIDCVATGCAAALQILFSFELSVACWVRPGYLMSLYFWIDLAATFSMLLDITALMDIVFHQHNSLAGTDPLSRGPRSQVRTA